MKEKGKIQGTLAGQDFTKIFEGKQQANIYFKDKQQLLVQCFIILVTAYKYYLAARRMNKKHEKSGIYLYLFIIIVYLLDY